MVQECSFFLMMVIISVFYADSVYYFLGVILKQGLMFFVMGLVAINILGEFFVVLKESIHAWCCKKKPAAVAPTYSAGITIEELLEKQRLERESRLALREIKSSSN